MKRRFIIPTPARDIDKPPDPVRHLHDSGPVVAREEWKEAVKVTEAVESVGSGRPRDVVTGVGCSRSCWIPARGHNVVAPKRGSQALTRQVVFEAWLDHAAHEVQAKPTSDEGRGGRPSILHRLSSAVLLPDDGCHWGGASADRSGDGDAWRQHHDGHRVDCSDCHGEGIALRNS